MTSQLHHNIYRFNENDKTNTQCMQFDYGNILLSKETANNFRESLL